MSFIHTLKEEDLGLYHNKPLDVNFEEIQKELFRALPLLKDGWGRKQNNEYDKLTNFIYYSRTYYELIDNYTKRVPDEKKDRSLRAYMIHRWYNYLTSTTAESIFCQYNIVEAEQNKKHKFQDIHILDTPFDIKLTVMPEKFYKYKLNDFKKREVRDELIKHLYDGQSKEGRFHTANRLFIVCRGKEYVDNNFQSKVLKHKFDLIGTKINAFLKATKYIHNANQTPFNRIKLNVNGVIHTPYSEIIIVNE